jgi:hypothetical protein
MLPTSLQSLAPFLSALFAALGLVLPGILKKDGYSDRVNQVIAFSVVLLASVALAAVQSQLGPDFMQDFLIVMTGMHMLLGIDGPFKSFNEFLQSNVNADAKPAPLSQFSWSPAPTAGAPGEEGVPIGLQQTMKLPVVKKNPSNGG